MYDKILVPLDGSELAEVALPYAEELAGRLDSRITLVYISEPAEDHYRHMHRLYMERVVEGTKQGAANYLERPQGRAIKVESAILVGHPAEEIVGLAEREDVGLVVMATHGRSGIGRWALGSVADKVVKVTKRPVVLIRAKGARPDVREKGILRKALVPLDGSQEGEAVIPYIEELASKLNAEVVLLQVLARNYPTYVDEGYSHALYTEQELGSAQAYAKDYLDKVRARLKQKGVITESEVRLGTAAEGIIDLADEINADVVAMSTHGRSGIGRWVFGSTTNNVLHSGSTPLLLVRASSAGLE